MDNQTIRPAGATANINLSLTITAGARLKPPAQGVLGVPRGRPQRRDLPHTGTKSSVAGAMTGQTRMKHAASRELFAYWNRRRGLRPAPLRDDIEPGDIRHLLANTFILGSENGRLIFRLAGTRLCALFGRELKSEPFLGLWEAPDAIEGLLSAVLDDGDGMVAQLTSENARGQTLELELLLLPLGGRHWELARILGLLMPLASPYWIGMKPLRTLRLDAFRNVSAPRLASIRLVRALAARKPPRLVVHEGGRQD